MPGTPGHRPTYREMPGSKSVRCDNSTWATFKDLLYRKSWLVYAKPPFGGPEQVFRYLGRYTHSVAISNHRIVELDGGNVRFRMKDYAAGGAEKEMTVSGAEFLRRFLMHVLPKGFTRIRHYGLCATGAAKVKLDKAREILTGAKPEAEQPHDDRPWVERYLERAGIDARACPGCRKGRLTRIRDVPAVRRFAYDLARPPP